MRLLHYVTKANLDNSSIVHTFQNPNSDVANGRYIVTRATFTVVLVSMISSVLNATTRILQSEIFIPVDLSNIEKQTIYRSGQ